MGELKNWGHSYGQNCYHLIWCPKYRYKILRSIDIRKVCEGALKLVAIQRRFKIHEMYVGEDHIHCFIEIPPTVSVSEAFQYLKGISSRILRRSFPWLSKYKALWSRGKFFRSVGNVSSDTVQMYISKSQGNWDYFDVRRKLSLDSQTRLCST